MTLPHLPSLKDAEATLWALATAGALLVRSPLPLIRQALASGWARWLSPVALKAAEAVLKASFRYVIAQKGATTVSNPNVSNIVDNLVELVQATGDLVKKFIGHRPEAEQEAAVVAIIEKEGPKLAEAENAPAWVESLLTNDTVVKLAVGFGFKAEQAIATEVFHLQDKTPAPAAVEGGTENPPTPPVTP